MSTAFVLLWSFTHSNMSFIRLCASEFTWALSRCLVACCWFTVRTFFRVINISTSVTQSYLTEISLARIFTHGTTLPKFLLFFSLSLLFSSISVAWRMHIANKNKSALHASLQWYSSCRETNDKRLNLLFFAIKGGCSRRKRRGKKKNEFSRFNSITAAQCVCMWVCVCMHAIHAIKTVDFTFWAQHSFFLAFFHKKGSHKNIHIAHI